jgi:very-short-patch-repair endonuclease
MASRHVREMRRHPTDAEHNLRKQLRQRQLDGLRFRRQQPLGPYIVDFFCPAKSLVIEVDGGQHTFVESGDAVRTQWLEARGYRVLGFWNNDVLANNEGVPVTILAAVRR